jgi:hypothetical protein
MGDATCVTGGARVRPAPPAQCWFYLMTAYSDGLTPPGGGLAGSAEAPLELGEFLDSGHLSADALSFRILTTIIWTFLSYSYYSVAL